MRKIFIIGLLMAIGGLSAAAQNTIDKPGLQNGTFVREEYVKALKTIPYTQVDTTKSVDDSERQTQAETIVRDNREIVTIKSVEFTYTLCRNVKVFRRDKLKLKEGDAVQFEIKNYTMYLIYPNGKKLKYELFARKKN